MQERSAAARNVGDTNTVSQVRKACYKVGLRRVESEAGGSEFSGTSSSFNLTRSLEFYNVLSLVSLGTLGNVEFDLVALVE